MSDQYTIHHFKHMFLRSFAASTKLRWSIAPTGETSFEVKHPDGAEVTYVAPRATMEQLIQDWQKVTEQETKQP